LLIAGAAARQPLDVAHQISVRHASFDGTGTPRNRVRSDPGPES
jgi:hypothetical protein